MAQNVLFMKGKVVSSVVKDEKRKKKIKSIENTDVISTEVYILLNYVDAKRGAAQITTVNIFNRKMK